MIIRILAGVILLIAIGTIIARRNKGPRLTPTSMHSPLVKSVLANNAPISEEHQKLMQDLFSYTEWLQPPLTRLLLNEPAVSAAYISQSFTPGKGCSVNVYLRSDFNLSEVINEATTLAATRKLKGASVEFIPVGPKDPMVARLADRQAFYRKTSNG